MARIRTIKPEFFTSEQIVECSTSARLLFVGLWCFSDDGGVHPASVKRIKMEVFPGDDISTEQVQGLIDELIRAKLIAEFESGGESYWCVLGWKNHQKIDRPTLKHPQLDDDEISRIRRSLDDDSTSTRRSFDEHSTSPRDGMEGKGMESKGKEEESTGAKVCVPQTDLPPDGKPKGDDEQTKPKPRFVPPTLTEVEAYCRERSNRVDSQRFHDFYTAKNWMVGKNKMRDWRAAVRTWERDSERQPAGSLYDRHDPLRSLREYAASGGGS